MEDPQSPLWVSILTGHPWRLDDARGPHDLGKPHITHDSPFTSIYEPLSTTIIPYFNKTTKIPSGKHTKSHWTFPIDIYIHIVGIYLWIMVIFHRFLYVYQRDNPITTRKAAGAEQRALRDVRHQRYSRGGALYRAGADDLVGTPRNSREIWEFRSKKRWGSASNLSFFIDCLGKWTYELPVSYFYCEQKGGYGQILPCQNWWLFFGEFKRVLRPQTIARYDMEIMSYSCQSRITNSGNI